MAKIKTLPLLPGAKFIVIDDALEATRAEYLISGWLQMWNDKGLGNAVEFFLFSGPAFVYEERAERFKHVDTKFHDFYTLFGQDSENDATKLERILDSNVLQANSVVIVDCLSSLVLTVGLAKALRFVEKLSWRAAQMICVYRRDFGSRKIPRIETLGTTYVRLERPVAQLSNTDEIRYEVSLNHRKQGGGILINRALICQEYASDSYEIVREEKALTRGNAETPAIASRTAEKPQASFRIEMNEREQEQRKNTPLPYGLRPTAGNASQILYEPDGIDDLDEEDPDDDLPF